MWRRLALPPTKSPRLLSNHTRRPSEPRAWRVADSRSRERPEGDHEKSPSRELERGCGQMNRPTQPMCGQMWQPKGQRPKIAVGIWKTTTQCTVMSWSSSHCRSKLSVYHLWRISGKGRLDGDSREGIRRKSRYRARHTLPRVLGHPITWMSYSKDSIGCNVYP